MQAPLVSLCIPTYNRARYLDSLLGTLAQQLQGFGYPYEVFIADNASTDHTPEVVRAHEAHLPLRYHRHAENLGCYPNVQYLMAHAAGRYYVHVSDDDCVLGEPLGRAVAAMETDPEAMILYAPWMLYDLVAQREQGQFYSVPQDLRIARGQHTALLDAVLRHHIFPEVQITRTEAMRRILPRVTDHAFFAFVQAADYLAHGAVRIHQEPFYVSMTRYFEDDTRAQAGTQEVEHAWDRYRGGLEYLMARAGSSLGAEERAGMHLRVQAFIAQRLAVAIRVRHFAGRDAVDTHMLAMRLRGMGYEHLLQVPMQVLASQATLQFLLRDPLLHRDAKRLLCLGPVQAGTADYLRQHASGPVEFLAHAPDAQALRDALVFVSEGGEEPELPQAQRQALNTTFVRERDLCERFGLVPG